MLSSMLLPHKGRFGLIDYEKAYTVDRRKGPDIFDLRGIDRERGAMVVVRPDQHVANVLPLDAHDDLSAFFERFMLDQHGTTGDADAASPEPVRRLQAATHG